MFNYGQKLSSGTELVKDVIQEVFIKIWNNRENLSNTTSIKYYLFTALKRKLFDLLKSAGVRQTEFLNDFDDIGYEILHDGGDGELPGQRERVLLALNRLSAQQKLLDLKFYKNL